MKSIDVEDFYKLKFLADLQIFENKIAFVVSYPQKKENDYNSSIWLYDGIKLKKFTSGPKDTKPRWNHNGKKLCFVSQRGKDKKNQLFVIDAEGGEAELLYESEITMSSPTWNKDGKYIYFLGTKEEKKDKKDDVKQIKTYPFYFNGKGFLHNKRTHLYRVNMNGKCTQISDGEFNVNAFDLSPTESKIVLNIRKDGWDVYKSELYTCTFEGKELKSLTNIVASYGAPKYSPDGEHIGFSYSSHDKGLFQHHKIHIVSSEGGTPLLVSDLDRNVGNSINSDSRFGTELDIKWSFDSKYIYFVVSDQGKGVLYRVNVQDKIYESVINEKQSIEGFGFYDDNIAYFAQTSNMPVELFFTDNQKTRRVTNFNKYFKLKNLKAPEHFEFEASDDEKIEGWILRYSGTEKSPAILEIHGGPKTAYGYAFMFEFHYLASNGYTVIFTNPRGSDSYSESFALNVKEHFGERDYRDLLEALDFVVKDKHIDENRIGVTGGSYGGFMTNWIIGHTDRFRAAVTQRSISNQISFFGASDIGPGFNGDQIGKTVWDNTETYWEKSPLKYVQNVKTPLLIIHSEEDYRCPVEQAYQLYTGLKYFGKEVEFLLFPNENHELSRSGKPNHRIKRLNAILRWFNKHLGYDFC